MDNPCWSAIRHPHCFWIVQEPGWGLGTTEAVYRPCVFGTQLIVAHPEAPLRCQTEYSYLALMFIAVYLERCLSSFMQIIRLGQSRVNVALCDESVGFPRLSVVGEVGPDDALEIHPEIPIVVRVPEARCGRTRHDRAASLGDEHAGAEGLPTGVLEHDVRVVAAGQLADAGAESLPLLRIRCVLVLPELEALGGPVDDQLGAHRATELGLLGAGHDADRDGAAV